MSRSRNYELAGCSIPELRDSAIASKAKKIQDTGNEVFESLAVETFRQSWESLAQDRKKLHLWEQLYIAGQLSEDKTPIFLAAQQYRLVNPFKLLT